MSCNYNSCPHYNALGCWVGQDVGINAREDLLERIRVGCPDIDNEYSPECKAQLLSKTTSCQDNIDNSKN